MRDIGTLGGDSYALGINDSGVVAGYYYFDDLTTRAFIWTEGRGMVDIGRYFQGAELTQGSAINASAAVAGTATADNGRHQVPALFVFPAQWTHAAPSMRGSDQRNFGYGVNDFNQVTGQFYTGGVVNGYLWEPSAGTFEFLPILPGGLHTVGNAINNLTHITGTGSVSSGAFEALFWTSSTGSQDIGVLNGSGYTAGEAINGNDEIAGLNSPELAGFYWSAATGMLPLQSLVGSQAPAFGINNSGMVAGYSSTADGAIHATRWINHSSAPQDLGTLEPGGNSYGRAINSLGQVVGYADVP